ncbi:MAG: hypothetical protein AT714_04605 [Vulcanisaeta sp. OSP_8]|jgi:hypothetical protein|nr:MAG: hypothetical protein AT714_04605 [Vulcanisaeta sp. OSP_8]
MHRSLFVFIIITLLLIPTLIISNAIYYEKITTTASVSQQPIVPERPPKPYISSFSVSPTGVNIDVSLNRSQITYVNNQGVVKIKLMELKISREGEITFKLNTPGYVSVVMMIYSSNGSLIGVYPNNGAITLSPGDYLIIEEVSFPSNINSFGIGGNYIFVINGVWLIYSINESIEIK